MNISRALPALLLVTSAALVAGCGESSDVSQTDDSHSAAKADGPSRDAVRKFFDNLAATDDPDALSTAAKATVPGSVAANYVAYHQQFSDAYADLGDPVNADDTAGQRLTKIDGGYKLCPSDGDCITWTNIKANGSRIATFDINGSALDDLLIKGSGAPVQAGRLASVTLLTAYESQQSKTLFLTLKVAAKNADVTVSAYEAKYRTAQGRQMAASDDATAAVTDLQANSTATIMIGFPGGKIGGDFSLPFYDDNGNEGTARISVKRG